MTENQAMLPRPCWTTMKAASKGPTAWPTLPPSWNTDWARPCRPPDARRATREDSGWKIEEPIPISAGREEEDPIGRRHREEEQADQTEAHAGRERIGLRAPVGEEADEGLEERRGHLEDEGDQPDLAEIELKAVLEDRIDRRQERLDGVVQAMADARRDQDRNDRRLRPLGEDGRVLQGDVHGRYRGKQRGRGAEVRLQ